jgi:hypothetical protein
MRHGPGLSVQPRRPQDEILALPAASNTSGRRVTGPIGRFVLCSDQKAVPFSGALFLSNSLIGKPEFTFPGNAPSARLMKSGIPAVSDVVLAPQYLVPMSACLRI